MIIYKYEIPLQDKSIVIPLPRHAKPLTVQLQGGTARMWVLLDKNAPVIPRYFRVVGTGHNEIADDMKYIGTWQHLGYVWHLWEEK
jgi:hypothetical protein